MTEQRADGGGIEPQRWAASERAENAEELANQALLATLYGDMADVADMPTGRRNPRVEATFEDSGDPQFGMVRYAVSDLRVRGDRFVERVDFVELLRSGDHFEPMRYDVVYFRGERRRLGRHRQWHTHEPLALNDQLLTADIAQKHMAEAVAEINRRARARRRRLMVVGGWAIERAQYE